MKNLLISFILICFSSNVVFADCDWKTGITPGPNNTYIYTEPCHLKVGQMVQDLAIKDQQITTLNKAIELKDLAIKFSDTRASLWMETSTKLEDRLQKVDSLEKTNQWLMFGLGVVTVLGAGFMAARLMGH